MKKDFDIIDWVIANKKVISIRAIEKKIGCPTDTLQKAVQGKQKLPKKWKEPLEAFIKSFCKDTQRLREEDMWCFNCEHEWNTKDYFNETRCPNCETKPIRIYRTSSTTFVYAYLEKHPEKKPQIK